MKDHPVCRSIAAILCIASLAATVSAEAEIYRWVDEHGQVHYTDEPQPDKGSKVELKVTQPSATPDAGELRRRALLEQARLEAEHKSAIAAKSIPAEPKAPLVDRCRPVRHQWYALTQEMPIYWSESGTIRAAWHSDPYGGKRIYIDEDERQELLRTTTQELQRHCPNGETDEADGSEYQNWLNIDDCIVSKRTLAEARLPRARTTRDKLEELEQDVVRLCGSPSGGVR